jgi:hypothetical protein
MIPKFWFESLTEETNRNIRRGWKDNIKLYLREIEFGGANSIYLTEDRDEWRAVVDVAMNLLFYILDDCF